MVFVGKKGEFRILAAVLLCAPLLSIAAPAIPAGETIDSGSIESGKAWSETPIDEGRITAMVTDQTMTQTGRSFMQGFSAVWRELQTPMEINIAVYERPSARWGSLIWVEENFRRVYQTFLYPGRGNPQAVGESAAYWVQQRVADAEVNKLLFKDPDIGKDEF